MGNTSSGTIVEPEILPKKKEKAQEADHSSRMMKAVRIHEYGDLKKLIYEDAPIPEAGPDEVLIKVGAAGVNPIDWKIREGRLKNAMPHQLPLILGWDVAGTIAHRGTLITRFKEGDAVFARPDITRNGCYAEYVAVKANDVAYAPVSIPAYQSAGVPLTSQTAWMGLFEVGSLKKDQRVLIQGGSGGVGTFAVQLAKIAGAYVAATTSGFNLDIVKSLGADEVIDYEKEDISQLNNFDMVFDTIGGETQSRSWQVLRKGGTLISTLYVNEKEAKDKGMIGKSFMATSNGARLQEIAGLIDKHILRVVIERRFTLSEAQMAHELSQSGKACGKIILEVSEKSNNLS